MSIFCFYLLNQNKKIENKEKDIIDKKERTEKHTFSKM